MNQERLTDYITQRNNLSYELEVAEFIEKGFEDYIHSGTISLPLLQNCSLVELLNYVVLSHRFYTEKKLPEISMLIHSLCNSFGQMHPSTLILNHFFHKYYREFKEHLDLEDQQIIPYVQTLVDIENGAFENLALLKLCDRYLLSTFHDQHSDTETDVKIVRRAINEFPVPKNAESQFRMLMDHLENFEKDLHFHSELEEKVLIPKALDLEKAIRG
ncbi:MAG: hypothetical protein KDC84_02225 [Crocinitomicaceae bacterium]|nr:hypothetical protein [Crocinitomicaceae bacterium]